MTKISYYNTTKIQGTELQLENINALNQEEMITELFSQYQTMTFTPYEVQKELNLFNTPITSIRRAMTNLTKKGVLMKTNEMRIGEFGKPCHTWRKATGSINDQLLMYIE